MKELTIVRECTNKVINIVDKLSDEANVIHATVQSTYVANNEIEVHVAYHTASIRFLELLEELKNA